MYHNSPDTYSDCDSGRLEPSMGSEPFRGARSGRVARMRRKTTVRGVRIQRPDSRAVKDPGWITTREVL